ncbi:hypothetical protein Q8A67_002084 [Cirrhinus molitorella]|uniref:Uncharacterized protein n=1 Tax=Cirrhinus molitorella TaxID=172907 RepID=A0AA88QH22_9TELE|nr:hypothetical protein Q8A67_002084 [Cirrhinus molitorella]
MTGISYTSSFLLILSLSLISDLTTVSASVTGTTEDPAATDFSDFLTREPLAIAEMFTADEEGSGIFPDSSTTGTTVSSTISTTIGSTTGTTDTTTKTVITTTTTTPHTTALQCHNGGTPRPPNNNACICPPGFTGRLCSNVLPEIKPDKIERAVNVTMEINERFQEDHKNPSSVAYKEFANKFNNSMMPRYKNISNFLRVDNLILSPGGPKQQRQKRSLALKESVKVEHDVILGIENDGKMNNTYDSLIADVQNILNETKNNPDDDFIINEFEATKTELNVSGMCDRSLTNDLDKFQDYFEPLEVEGSWICASQCNEARDDQIICENEGTCAVSDNGPTCFCHHTDGTWFFGDRCHLQVDKNGFYAGIGTVAAAAVIALVVLTVYIIINNRKVKKNKDIKQDLVKEWLEDDFEWPQQKKTADNDNPVYSPGSTRNFSPESDVHQRYLQRDQSMRLDRPQIRSSFDT